MNSSGLAHELHVLVARLDLAAERVLRTEHGTTYRRFRTLLAVHELGAVTQRQLAEHLAVSEASASRMVATLVGDGLLAVGSAPGSGRGHELRLTAPGGELLTACRRRLEGRFETQVRAAGVDPEAYAEQTRRLAARLAEVASLTSEEVRS